MDRYHDMSISEISADGRSRLEECPNENLFASTDFGELYCYPSAERVRFVENESGAIIEKFLYRKRPLGVFFTELQGIGPIDPHGEPLNRPLMEQPASVVSIPFNGPDGLPRLRRGWLKQNFRQTAEDTCIDLPKSTHEYLQSLGAKTRRHLPYYVRRLQREWREEWRFEPQYGQEISRKLYDKIFELNHMRMDAKGKRNGWTDALKAHRWALFQKRGLFCGLSFRGRLVGGTLSLIHNNEAYLIVIAHDPQFDRLNLGSVSLWLTVEHLIESSYRRYHLMWGSSFYKEQFGGKTQPLYTLTLFSNPLAALFWYAANSYLPTRSLDILKRVEARRSSKPSKERHASLEQRAGDSMTRPVDRRRDESQGIGIV